MVDSDEMQSDEVDSDEVDPDEVDPDKVDLVDPDLVVMLAAAVFMSDSTSHNAQSLRSSKLHGLLTHGANVALHDPVLDALEYVSVIESPSVVAIGLIMKPLQLVVATNNQTPSETLDKYLTTICLTLQKLSDRKFSYKFFPGAKLAGVTQTKRA